MSGAPVGPYQDTDGLAPAMDRWRTRAVPGVLDPRPSGVICPGVACGGGLDMRCCSVLYDTFLTTLGVPYNALSQAITRSYDERTRLNATRVGWGL